MLRATAVGMTTFNAEVGAVGVIGDNVITKRPVDVLQWDEIARRHPMTKFIVTIRDPRGMVTSKHPRFDRYTASADFYLAGGAHPIEYRPHGILNTAAKIRELLAARPETPVIRYEELVDDPAAVQQRIGQATGLVFCGRFADFHRHETDEWPALRGVRPVDPQGKDKWRNDPDRIREQFTSHPELFDLVEEYGYEPDRSWFEAV